MKMKETTVVGFGEVSPRSGGGDLTRVQDDGSGSLEGGRRWAAGGDRRGEVGIRVRVSELRGEGGVAGERLRAWAE